MDSPLWIYCIGLCSQLFFTSRVLVQWFISERRGKSESPSAFWILSILASMLMCIYGWLRRDAAIVLGEFLAYYIYMWNISAKGLYRRVHWTVPLLQAMLPPLAFLFMLRDVSFDIASYFMDNSMTTALMILGISGQIVFKSRFLYQFIYSVRRKQSLMPLSFWMIAVAGSLLIIVYAFLRHDWVLLLGQFSIVPSVRNIMLIIGSRRHEETDR